MAGTVFLDVLIWKCCQSSAESDLNKEQNCPPLYCLKGHEGSIHRYNLSSEGHLRLHRCIRHTAVTVDVPSSALPLVHSAAPGTDTGSSQLSGCLIEPILRQLCPVLDTA